MIARTLWLRPLAKNPIRFIATVAGVATGVAAVVATLLASRAAVASLTDGVDAIAGEALLEIRAPAGVDEGVLAELRDLAGEAHFAPVIDRTALLDDQLVRVLGTDLLIDAEGGGLEGQVELETSDDLDAMLLRRGVALPRSIAEAEGFELGDTLDLRIRSKLVQLEVAGIFEATSYESVWERVLVVDIGTARELFDTGERVDRIAIRPRLELDVAGLDRLAERVSARLATWVEGGLEVAPPGDRRRQAEQMLRSLEFNLTALSGISVLVGAVLVATTLATSIVQRRRLIALFRSLGASKGQIAGAVLAEAGTIGMLGGALGVLGGWLGARASVASVATTVNSIATEAMPGAIVLEPRWIAFGMLLGIGTSLAAALLPLNEATSIPPVQGLAAERPQSVAGRRSGARWIAFLALLALAGICLKLPPVGDLPIWSLLASTLLMGVLLVLAAPLVDLLASPRLPFSRSLAMTPVRVAQAALEAGRARAAWAAGAVGIAVALAVSMTTMIGSFRHSVIEWTDASMRSDVYLRPSPGSSGIASGTIDPEVVRLALDRFGPDAVDPFHSAAATFRDQRITFAGAAFDVVARVGGVPFIDGRRSQEVFAEALETGGIVVNEPFARRFEVQTGDSIAVETGSGVIEREVVGVYRDYSHHTGLVVARLDDFFAHYPDEGPQSVAIFLPPEVDAAAAKADLLEDLGGRFMVDALLNRELRAEVVKVFDQTFAVTIALQIVAAGVAVIAVLLVLYALVSERRRELAVARVLGGSRRQIVAIVLSQAGLLGTAGATGGLAAGLAVGWVLVKVVNVQSFGWSLQFIPPWNSIALTALAVVPAALIAGLGPALATLRTSPQEVLRDDG